MKQLTTIALASLALAALTTRAHADEAVVAGLAVGLEIAPIAMGIADLAGHDASKAYGAAEIVVGGVATVANLGMASLFARGGDEQSGVLAGMFVGIAVIDIAVVIHGMSVVSRPEKARPPLSISIGSARGQLAPTVVSDGRSTTAGLGLGGTF